MKDNVNLKILLDDNHQTWIKLIFFICRTRRRKNWTHTDLEPPTHFQMGLKSCHQRFPNGPQYSPSGRIWSNSNRSILVLPKIPHYIERAPQNVRTGRGYASHRGWLSIKVITPLRTSENMYGTYKTSDIIPRTTEDLS